MMTSSEKIKALNDEELTERLRLIREGIPEVVAVLEERLERLSSDLGGFAVKLERVKRSCRKSARK